MVVTHTLNGNEFRVEGRTPREVYSEVCKKRGVHSLSELNGKDFKWQIIKSEMDAMKPEDMVTREEILN